MAGHSRSGGQNHAKSNSISINQRAQLANAYQELGKELGSEKLKVVGGYTLGRVIGEGTYGSVHIATHRLTGTRCAIKKIPKSLTSQLTREIHHHRLLHHPHILHLYEVLATESHIWLATELCTGGELFDYLVERGRLLEGEGRRVFGELVVAVGTMHKKGTVHRDLKLENVFLDGECRVKLGDLGFAREWSRGGKLLETFCGTTGYASPEMLQGQKYSGEETDIWSLGIILYILLCGGLPFDDDDEDVMKRLIITGEYEEPEWLSEEAKHLIRNMLKPVPSERLTITQILSHPWFTKRIIDPPIHTVPGAEGPHTPHLNSSPDVGRVSFFSEPVANSNGQLTFPSQLTASGSSAGAPGSPLQTVEESGVMEYPTRSASGAGSGRSVTIVTPSKVEESSSSSSDSSGFRDSDKEHTGSGTTTPTTAEGGEVLPDIVSPLPDKTQQASLTLLQSNESQSTIRRTEEALSRQSSGSLNTAGTVKGGKLSVLEDQREEDENEYSDLEHLSRRTSANEGLHDEWSLHLPVAGSSRTPSRTKRKSQSSTMSDRRPSLLPGSSFSSSAPPCVDYLSQLLAPRPAFFSTPMEKELLNSLSALGFDTGQMMHSVNSNACDASSATWWMLRVKQLMRMEVEEEMEKAERAEAMRKLSGGSGARRQSTGVSASDSVSDVFLTSSAGNSKVDLARIASPQPLPPPPEPAVVLGPAIEVHRPSDATTASPPTDTEELPPIINSKIPASSHIPSPAAGKAESARISSEFPLDHPDRPKSPPRSRGVSRESTPTGISPTASPRSKRAEVGKMRSPSFTILQRAISVFNPDTSSRRPSDEDKEVLVDEAEEQRLAQLRKSPNKLVKPHPLPKEPEHDLPAVPKDIMSSRNDTSRPSGSSGAQTEIPSSSSYGTVKSLHSITSSMADSSPSRSKVGKAKRESILTTFRAWFNEDRRKRKRADTPISPATSQGRVGGYPMSYAPSRPQYTHPVKRTTVVSRISPGDSRPVIHSRRSSSVNSRRSSLVDLSSTSPVEAIGLSRRISGSRRSGGSRTPTSEAGHGSRPSSVHSLQMIQGGAGPGPSQSLHHHSASMSSAGSAGHPMAHLMAMRSPQQRNHYRVSGRTSRGGRAPGPHHRTASSTSSRSHASSRRSSGADHEIAIGDEPLFEEPGSDADLSHDETSSVASRRKSGDSGHLRATLMIARRTKSPLSSGTASSYSLSHPHVHHFDSKPKRDEHVQYKAKPPLRDVFANKGKNRADGDDDWISEDEDSGGFAGGLGQTRSSNKWGQADESGRGQGGSPMFKNDNYSSSAAPIPFSRNNRRGGREDDQTKDASAPVHASGRGKPDPSNADATTTTSETTSSSMPPPPWGGSRGRSGLPRPTGIKTVQEEEEEEEEE